MNDRTGLIDNDNDGLMIMAFTLIDNDNER